MCMNNVSYKDFYNLLQISGVIIIEDSIFNYAKRNPVIYDFLRLTEEESKGFLNNIQEEIRSKLFRIYNIYNKDKSIIEWNEVIPGEIEEYLEDKNEKELFEAINSINDEEIEEIEEYAVRYGLGISNDGVDEYREILEGLDLGDTRKPLRIYKSFDSDEVINIRSDIGLFTEDNKYALIIIDDYLEENARGNEIINFLNKNYGNSRIICIMFTSRDKKDIDIKNLKMYTEIVAKGCINQDSKIKRALIKSQYYIMINCLKENRTEAIEMIYEYAKSNIDIAIHLSDMAKYEGITNYEIITDWLELREKYYTLEKNLPRLKSMILLSSILDRLEEIKNNTAINIDEIKEMQVFEKFDYNINKLNLPIEPGDIFFINEKYYMLVGQECDLSIRGGKRNEMFLELIPVNIVNSKKLGESKQQNGYEKMLISDFKEQDGHTTIISIDCTQRIIIDSSILDLCVFNIEGKSQIDLNESLTPELKYMLPSSWEEYFGILKEKYEQLIDIKRKINEFSDKLGFGIENIQNSLLYSNKNSIISLMDFTENGNKLSYNVERICRLKKHMLLANKLYLEYRGRQAFNTINMESKVFCTYDIINKKDNTKYSEAEAVIILTNKRSNNGFEKYKNRIWIIKKKDIENFIKSNSNNDYSDILKTLNDYIMLDENIRGNFGDKVQWTKYSKNEKLELQIQLL